MQHLNEVKKFHQGLIGETDKLLAVLHQSKTKHKDSKIATRVLLYPFTQFKSFLQFERYATTGIAIEAATTGLSWFGLTQLPFTLSTPILTFSLFIVWFVLSMVVGYFSMSRLRENNPHFFYKAFRKRHPEFYSILMRIAKDKVTVTQAIEELEEEEMIRKISVLEDVHDELKSVRENYEKEMTELEVSYETRLNEINDDYTRLMKKLNKVLLNGQTNSYTIEDLNLISTEMIVYREDTKHSTFVKEYDSTSIYTPKNFASNTFYEDYSFIHPPEEEEDIIVGDKTEEFYTYHLVVDGVRWVITYVNTTDNDIMRSYFLGQIVDIDVITETLKNIIKKL